MKKYANVNEDLLNKIKSGCQKITDNVAITLGPKGRNVVMRENGGPPLITKDGVTVARFVDLEEEFEDLAAQILKQASVETVERAGDGTTTSLIIANGIVQESIKMLMLGESPVRIKNDLEKISQEMEFLIRKISKPITSAEQIKNIATVSVNGDEELGDLISKAVDAVGKAGSIIVEESKRMESVLDFEEGFQIDAGYYGPSFINDRRRNMAMLEDPYVFVSDLSLKDVNELKRFLNLVGQSRKPLVIVVNEVEVEPLALLAHAAQTTKRLILLRAPRYGLERKEILEDLAVSVGANFISVAEGKRLRDVTLSDLGTCEKIEVGLNSSLFTGCGGTADDIDERMEQLEARSKQTKDDKLIMRLQERITRLSAGVAVVRVGGLTQVDVKERRDRVDDALEAVRMAIDSGLIPGGALIPLLLSEYVGGTLKDSGKYNDTSIDIMKKALAYPFKQLCDNADISFRKHKEEVLEKNKDIVDNLLENRFDNIEFDKSICLDFAPDEPEYASPLDRGIIDPSGVLINAIQNSVSAAATLITTGVAIVLSGKPDK